MAKTNLKRNLEITLFTIILFSAIYWTVAVFKNNLFYKNIVQFLVLVAGIADAYKYSRLQQKIVRTQSSRDVSRMFSMIAIICDIIFVAYTLMIKDPFLIFVRSVALYTTVNLYFFIYLYYPFKMRKLDNFKRPSLWVFILNTLEPNGRRKRL